jgi:myo-inositol-1(or 4)-monophosphatase
MGRKVRTGLGDRKVSDSRHLLDVARRAATRAAAHVRDVSRPEAAAWQLKGQSDFVTRVDRETEQLIGEILLAETPDASILGEELTPELQHEGLVWVVDPLDGTTNFLHGYPAYGVSVAAAVDGEIVAGAIADVTRDALYHAVRGGGAWEGERRLEVSTVIDPENALIGTGYPFKVLDLMPAYLRQFTTILQRTSGIRRAGAASLDFVDIALGRFDGFWELYLAPWDVAAGALIVREAGGVVTDLEGGGEIVRHGAFVAGNRVIHGWLMELLQETGG